MPSRTALTRCKAQKLRRMQEVQSSHKAQNLCKPQKPSRAHAANSKRLRLPWILAAVVAAFVVCASVMLRLTCTQQQEEEQSLEYSIDQVLGLSDGSETLSIEPGSYTTSYGTVVVQREEDDVVEVASKLLENYQASEEAELVYAEYLDLFGNVWAGILQGDAWVEICLVMERDSYCEVRAVRLLGEQIQALEDIGGDSFEEA